MRKQIGVLTKVSRGGGRLVKRVCQEIRQEICQEEVVKKGVKSLDKQVVKEACFLSRPNFCNCQESFARDRVLTVVKKS